MSSIVAATDAATATYTSSRVSGQACRRGYRRSHRRSTMLESLGLALIAALLVGALFATSGGHLASQGLSVRIKVNTGDTLWSIARRHPIPGLTTAQTADLIAQVNYHSGATLTPGATLDVPVAEAPALTVACR